MNDIDKIMRRILADVEVELGDEFDKNFERQAFFSKRWQRRKSPDRNKDRAILTDTSALRKSIQSRVSGDSIVFYSDLPYAEIHNEGGEIVVTERMKRYFRYKFYDEAKPKFKRKREGTARRPLGDGGFYAWTSTMELSPEAEFWRFMALKKVGSKIMIPKRQFLGVSPEVEKTVREIIEEQLAEYFGNDFKLLDNK